MHMTHWHNITTNNCIITKFITNDGIYRFVSPITSTESTVTVLLRIRQHTYHTGRHTYQRSDKKIILFHNSEAHRKKILEATNTKLLHNDMQHHNT